MVVRRESIQQSRNWQASPYDSRISTPYLTGATIGFVLRVYFAYLATIHWRVLPVHGTQGAADLTVQTLSN